MVIVLVPILILFPALVSGGRYPEVSIPCSVLAFVVGCGVAFFVIFNTYSDREDLPTAAQEKYGITNLEPARGANEFTFCGDDLEPASERYTWTDEEGDAVEGTIERSAEQDGKCTFTLIPNP